MKTFDGYKKQALTDVYALLAGGGHQTISSLSVNYANSAGNADTVDGYHISDESRQVYRNYYTVASPAGAWILIKLPAWNANNEIVTISGYGDNRQAHCVVHCGSRFQGLWGYQSNYNCIVVSKIRWKEVDSGKFAIVALIDGGITNLSIKSTSSLEISKTTEDNAAFAISSSFFSSSGVFHGNVDWDKIIGKPSSFTPSAHSHSWTSITDKLVAGNEFNIVNAGFNNRMWFNYVPINDRSKTATILDYGFGNGHQGYATVTASGFVKNGSSSSYVLLGDGGHKTISSLSVNYASSAGNADTVDGEHASNFSYTHQTSFDFSKSKSGRIVTFDQSGTDYGWINGFASTHSNYLTSVIFNTHRTSNWYVGYIEANTSTGVTKGLTAVKQLAFLDSKVADSDKLDGIHANGLLTELSNSNNGVSITIGGTTKSVSNISVNHAASSTKSEYSRSLLGRSTSGSDYGADSSNLVFAEWNTMNDSRWYLKATDYECRVAYANNAGNADTLDNTHLNGIFTAFGNNGHNITATIGGTTKSFLVNWAADSNKLDGYHASDLLTSVTNTNNGISVTVGGTTKSVSNISVNYASSAGSATKVIVNQHTTNDTNYPLVWSNQNNSNNATENQLYKSWSDLYYNPKNKRLTVGGSVVASSFIKSGGTSQQLLRADGGIATFNWSGQSGQPTWLWGGNNQHSYYVYNPSNFRVAYATSAGSADTLDGVHLSGIFTAFGNNGHNITATIGGTTKSFLVNWAADSDKLDGYHASNLLTSVTNTNNGISVTVGGTTKSVSNISVNYATSSGNADTAQYLRSLGNQNCQTGRTQNYGDVYTYNTYANNTGAPTSYTSVIGFGRGIAGTVEIAGGWDNTNLYWRSLRDCCEDWYSWRTVLDSSNYTEFINNYYWANVKISTSSSTTTSPTVSNLTATSSIRMGNIYLQNTNEINSASGIHLNYQNSGNISLCAGGGNVGIGTISPAYKLDVNGQVRASGFRHSSVNSDNYMLLAGGGYKSFGGNYDNPIFLGYLNLDHGSDGTVSSSFYCLGYSVPFTYTRGGNYCRISIPDTSYQVFYIRAAIASVNYSGGGMDTWTGNRRGDGAWWLHCYASSSNEVRVKGFRQNDTNNDSWWGGNPLIPDSGGANRITVCIFGYVSFR